MARMHLQGTNFSFSLLPLNFFAKGDMATAEISIENEWISYKQTEKCLSAERVEEWIFCMFRLLAGAYKREYSLSLEEAGIIIDFYPYTIDGNGVSRAERRERDCIMAIRMLMRSKKKAFLGGVYTLLLHRNEIENFAKALREEYDKIFIKRIHGMGEYLFVGVSPLGYTGCNYWYFDAENKVKKGDYVWVEMGSHNTKQIVYVDSVRSFKKETAPYSIDTVKQILSIATEEEIFAYCKEKNIAI